MSDDTSNTANFDIENKEWIDSLNDIYRESGPERVRELLRLLQTHAQKEWYPNTICR